MGKINKWIIVKDFVNQNEVFEKKTMRATLNIKDAESGYTESLYINHLKNAGFLKRIGRGKYKRLVKIPDSMNSGQILKLSYDYALAKKYMVTLIRKQKLENIKENNL